jgi:hypothetical protein
MVSSALRREGRELKRAEERDERRARARTRRRERKGEEAKSFLDRGWTVHLVGYFSASIVITERAVLSADDGTMLAATPLPSELVSDRHLHQHDISPPGPLSASVPASAPRPVFLLLAAIKILYTSIALFFTLVRGIGPVPGWVMVQVCTVCSFEARSVPLTSRHRIRRRYRRCR